MRFIPPSLSLRVLAVSTILVACYGAEPTAPKDSSKDQPTQKPVISLAPDVDTLHAIGDTLELSAQLEGPGSAGALQASSLAWRSLNRDVVDVTDVGKVVSKGVGVALVTVGCGTCANQLDTATVYVQQVPAAVTVTPGGETLVVGDAVQLEAVAADSNQVAIQDATFTWHSSDSNLASVTDGKVSARRPGSVTITAKSGPAVGRSSLTVSARSVDHISVKPASPSLAVGDTVRLKAAAYDSTGAVIAGASFGWYSSDLTIGVVSDGLLEGKSEGTVTISAKAGGKAGKAHATVTPPKVVTISVSPPQATIKEGASLKLTATAYDAQGNDIGTTKFNWSTSNKDVAHVTDGTVDAVSAGSARITATAAGVSGSSDITITSSTSDVASISVRPSSATILVGDSVRLKATALNSQGDTITSVAFTWSSSNSTIATVSNGLVQGRAAGSAIITAASGAVKGSAAVTVQADDPPPPPGSIAAFPGAEGYGGTALQPCRSLPIAVHKVTSMNAGAAGSLPYILSNEVSDDHYDIIEFTAGGTMVMGPPAVLANKCIYIAGQTAPGGGVQLRGPGGSSQLSKLIVATRDRRARHIVIRYLRLRIGKQPNSKGANMGLSSGEYIVVDHISTAWSNDENVSVSPVKASLNGQKVNNVTIQWSMLTTGLWPHTMGLQVTGSDEGPWPQDVSVHHNLLENNGYRNPIVEHVFCIEVVNNVVYNWRGRVGNIQNGSCADYVGNYWKRGPWTQGSTILQAIIDTTHGFIDDPKLFMQWNIGDAWQLDPDADQTTFIQYGRDRSGPLPDTDFVSSPQATPTLPVTVSEPVSNFDQVLSQAGASRKLTCQGDWTGNRDALDQLLISQVRNGQGPSTDDENDDQSDYGGYPNLAAGTVCADGDGDGMPDEFEQRFGLNPQDPSDAAEDLDKDGYLNIEEYLNGTDPTQR